MMKKRSLKDLEEKITIARTKKQKARAYYKLGLFHDNNSREIKAIPYYKKAIVFGLDKPTKAKALAYLASSMYKTNNSKKAIKKLNTALKITKNIKLRKFLLRLKNKIKTL